MSFWDKHVEKLITEFNGETIKLSKGLIEKTIAYMDARYTRSLYEELENDENLEKVIDPDFGKPRRHKGYSMTTLRCLTYINHLKKFGDLNEVDTVTDFGGGYGNFCRIWKLLYPDIRYYNVDLRQMLEIQKLYIENTVKDRSRIAYITHKQLDNVQKNNKSLFLAAYSLSECSREIRDEVEPHLYEYDYILIVHNERFTGIDNIAYFGELKDRLLNKNYECTYEMDKKSEKWWLTCKKQEIQMSY